MLISGSNIEEGSKVTFEGDKVKGMHVENVTAILRQNMEDRKDPNNGFSKGRMFRQIARLSNFAYYEIKKKYPDIDLGDILQKKAAWRKVRQDPQFSGYFCVSGGI